MDASNSYFFEFIPSLIKDTNLDKSKMIGHETANTESNNESPNQKKEMIQIKIEESKIYWIICHNNYLIIPENEKRIALYEYASWNKINIDFKQSLLNWNTILCFVILIRKIE